MSNASSSSAQLISPAPYRPWIVEVVSAVPKALADDLDRYVTGATCPGWACLGLPNGQVFVWQHHSSHLGSGGTGAFQVNVPKHMITLFHPAFCATTRGSGDAVPLLVALAPADRDAVFVYVAHPTGGVLVVWKVTQKDLQNAMGELTQPKYAHTYLDLERYDDDDDDQHNNGSPNKRPRRSLAGMTTDKNHNNREDEMLTSLTVISRNMVVLGTSSGSVFCCTQTTIPVSLHAQRAVPAPRKTGGILSSLFGSSSRNQRGPISDGSPIVCHLPWTTASRQTDQEYIAFVSISELGNLVHWTVIPTVASTHKVTIHANHIGSLLGRVQQVRVTEQVEVLHADMAGQHLHVLLRSTHRMDDDTTDCRLYWVRLRLAASEDEADSDGDSPPAMEWVSAQWLNRFPAPQDVQVMGLILTDNGMAYAAFHQRSGGVTSSVIVMALSDPALTRPEDNNMEDFHSNNDDDDRNAVVIYEVDLPMTEIPSLLPSTLAKDVVTHGCCVLARSGLGIRIRVVPLTQSQHPTSPRGGASPRKKPTANPALVHTLTTHLSAAFWTSYEHPAASLQLPPSLLQASSSDLEEAVVAAASHMQQQGGDAYTTSNVLEWHLAYMEMLRQSGLYRKLSDCARWRLLKVGQEIAVFLALGMPLAASSPKNSTENAWEVEQLSQLLSSHGIAKWLQQKLNEVLGSGMGDPSNYHAWCGWLSTALATAMTYREERASVPYDILPQHPPLVSSQELVPVWTSHPCLQDVLRRNLEYWKINPRSILALPHAKIIEVVVEAALASFADSAYSLATEEALGYYDEIKALAIPLLRRISRQKEDRLAFSLSIKHEYYEGICQIAHDHESKKDRAAFRLDPLFASNTQCVGTDYQTGLAFGRFVMNWHTDRGLFGHAIMYGRHCPQDLNYMLQSDKRLHQYQWIQAVHRGDYEGASKSLLSNADANKDATLASTRWTLCVAKLSNLVLVKESKSQECEARDTKIDQQLELIAAQSMLFEDEASEAAPRALSARRLLETAMQRVDLAAKSNSKEDAIRYCNIGLAICATFDDPGECKMHASEVWAKSIAADKEAFETWLKTEDDLTNPTLSAKILEETVFGGVLFVCEREPGLSKVTFGLELESDVLEKLGSRSGAESMRRLLQSTTKFHETGGVAYRESDAIMMN